MANLLENVSDLEMNTGFVRMVLDRTADGTVWTSPSVGDGACHARHSYGMSLVWGERVGDAFDEIVAHLRSGGYRTGDEWLQVDPRWAHLPWARCVGAGEGSAAGPVDVEEHVRLNFSFDPEDFRVAQRERTPPRGWTIDPAGPEDFDAEGSVVPRMFWREAAQFLAHGGGRRARREGETGALAFTSYRWGDEVELGIETAAAHRGRGLGRAVAAAMIADVTAQGLTPVWSCRAANAASERLARSVGFRISRRLPYWRIRTR